MIYTLSTLSRAHDLDAVAVAQDRIAPRRARHDRAIERDRNAALHGVAGFFR
jgi:hypothetical protein